MIKAIFLDIDGTLVSFQTHQVPSSTIEAVRQARQRGVKVFVCTGRPPQYIDNLKGMEFDGMVCTNGALCIDSQGQIIHRHPMDGGDIRNLVQYTQTQPDAVPFIAVDDHQVFAFRQEHPDVQMIMQTLKVPQLPTRPLAEAVDYPILELMGFYPAEQDALMQQLMPHSMPTRWHARFTDMIAKGVSKAMGIDHIIAHYGISLSETMAIGDGGNDIAMLQHAAVGVAMGNASDEVKAHANYITTSVDEDGIWNALVHYDIIPPLQG